MKISEQSIIQIQLGYNCLKVGGIFSLITSLRGYLIRKLRR